MNMLVVLARVPAPGEGKSRLRATLGDTAVDLLATAFVEDVLSWSPGCADAVLVAHDGPAELLPRSAHDLLLVAQVEGDLGDRIDAAVAAAFARGGTHVVIIGTDCPTVPASLIEAAFAGLPDTASTLIPATDGGWIALGIDRPLEGILASVTWSSEHAGRQTVDALARDRRPPRVLAPWHDIDEAGDIRRLQWDTAQLERAPRTAAVLAALATPGL